MACGGTADDTGIARHGDHCIGTARQYSGTLGRVDRCPVIPSLHAAGPSGSLRVGARLYLPDSWTDAPERPKKAEVPDGVTFCTKWELMMGLLEEATQTSPGAASEDAPLERWVYLAKLRWRVERDYQEMKTEVGLNHYAVDPSTRALHFGGVQDVIKSQ